MLLVCCLARPPLGAPLVRPLSSFSIHRVFAAAFGRLRWRVVLLTPPVESGWEARSRRHCGEAVECAEHVAEASRGLGGRLRRAFMSQVLMKFDTMYLCTYVGTYVRTVRMQANQRVVSANHQVLHCRPVMSDCA